MSLICQKRLLSLKYILLAVVLSALSCYLYLQMDIQPLMAQGDHGRDLYVFDRTVQGDQVYADYWWVYGPAMPHYYAFFVDKLGGHGSFGHYRTTSTCSNFSFILLPHSLPIKLTRYRLRLSGLYVMWFSVKNFSIRIIIPEE